MREDLKLRAEKMRWFHSIDLGGFQTAGRFPAHMPPNCTLFPAMDLLSGLDVKDSRCLDIGTANGLSAFGLERMGGTVVATDILPTPSPCFSLAADALESTVDYRYNVALRDAVTELGQESFDVVVCAGVLYHLLTPSTRFGSLGSSFEPTATSSSRPPSTRSPAMSR